MPHEFDPEVERLLAVLANSDVPPLNRLPIADARKIYRDKREMLGGHAPVMAETRDLAATGHAGHIPLRLYRPTGADPVASPALIYLHGGGYTIGDLDSHDSVCRQIAQASGVALVSVDYRLAPEYPFPAAAEDAIAATRWILANARSLGLDSARIGIGGDSAGGNLSAVTCQALRGESPALRCQILIYPATDASESSEARPSRVRNAEVAPLTPEIKTWFVESYLPEAADRSNPMASPLLAEDLSGLPPALVITAGFDPLHDEGREYADRLEAAGVEVLRRHFPGQIHGFIEMAGVLSAANEAFRTVAFMLRERL